jgi:hypothetical protein
MFDTAIWAAMWWADKLRTPVAGKGIGEKEAEESINLVHLFAMGTIDPPTEEQVQRFEDFLAKAIDKLLREEGHIDFYRDYNTPPLIRECFVKAAIPLVWDMRFPHKTGMRINQSQVVLKDGYGAPYTQVFP